MKVIGTVDVKTKVTIKGKEMYIRGKEEKEKHERGVVITNSRGYAKVYFDKTYSETPIITAVYVGKRSTSPIRRKIPTTTDITFLGEPNLKINWYAVGVRQE